MAGNLGTAGYRMNLDTKSAQSDALKLTKGLRTQEVQANKTGGGLARLAMKAVALGVAYLGVRRGIRALSTLVKESIDLSNIQIAAETKLTLKFGEEAQALIDLAGAMQKVTSVGDEMTIGGQAQLAFYRASTEAINKLTPAMLDMAASGKDMKTVSEILGKAMAGEVSTLKRYGIMFSKVEMEIFKTATQMERADLLVKKMDANWKGLAKTMRGTGLGAWDAMNNAIGDVKESLGDVATKSKVAGAFLNSLTTSIEDASPEAEALAIAFDEIIKGMIQTGIVAAEAIAPMLRYLKTIKSIFDIGTIISPAGILAAGGISNAMDAIKDEYTELFDYLENENFGDEMLEVLRRAQESIKDIQSGTQADLSHLHKNLSDSNLEHDEENAEKLGDKVAAEMTEAATATKAAFQEAFSAIEENAQKLAALTRPEKPGLEGDTWERGWTSQFISDRPGGGKEEEGKRSADEIAQYEQDLAEFTAEEQRLIDERRALQTQAMNAAIAEGQKSFAEEQKALDAANIQELAEQQNEALEMVGNVRISQEKKVLDTLADDSMEIVKEFASEMAQAGNAYYQTMLAAGAALTGSLEVAITSMGTLNEGANEYEKTMRRVQELQGEGGGEGEGGGRGGGGGGDGDSDSWAFEEPWGGDSDGGGGDGGTKSGAWNGGDKAPPGGGGVTINVYAAPGQSTEMIARSVKEQIMSESRRNIPQMALGGIEGYRGR